MISKWSAAFVAFVVALVVSLGCPREEKQIDSPQAARGSRLPRKRRRRKV